MNTMWNDKDGDTDDSLTHPFVVDTNASVLCCVEHFVIEGKQICQLSGLLLFLVSIVAMLLGILSRCINL